MLQVLFWPSSHGISGQSWGSVQVAGGRSGVCLCEELMLILVVVSASMYSYPNILLNDLIRSQNHPEGI